MLLDAVFRSVDDETVLAAYVKILGQRSEQLLSNLDPLLRAACSSGTIQSPLIQEHLADVCELGIKAWLPSDESSLAEAPTKDWLKVYLGKEATSGVYNAFSQDDRVWAVYTYFCWRPVTDRRKEALRKATELLVDLANDKDAEEEARREGMFIQLNLEANAEGWTPLHRACSKGRTETVRSLMTSLSADRSELMETDKSGFKPLHLACINGHVEVARVLIEAGAEIDTRDDVGYTGLMFAAGEGGAL